MKTPLNIKILQLLQSRPFYAHFFLNSRVILDKKIVPTAGAAVEDTGTVLYFNPDFIDSITSEELGGVIEHEVLHLLFEHPLVLRDETINKQAANVAMDCSINQYIEHLPKGCVTLPDLSKMLKDKLEPFQTWEYYYAKIKQNMKKIGATNSFDKHDMQKGDGKITQEQKAVLKDVINKAVKDSAGQLPHSIKKLFPDLFSPPRLPWKTILRNFIASATNNTRINTRKKTNRRFGINVPGVKKKRELTLGVCVDSSGSISDEDYKEFLNEIAEITKYCTKTYFVEADCVVQSFKELKKNEKPTLQRMGSGGTLYGPAISKCMERSCDAIVYFGDFDTGDKVTNPHIPFLWVGVGSSPKPADFGWEVRLHA